MNLLTLNQYLVADKIYSEQAADAYENRRKQVEAALLEARKQMGLVTADVILPGLGVVATVTLKKGSIRVDADEDALLATVEKHQPTEVEETVDPKVLEDPEVLAWLRENRPDSITRRVRAVWRTALLRQAQAAGGYITTDTGDRVKVADVTRHEPNGAFQLTFADADRAEMAAAVAALGTPTATPNTVEDTAPAAQTAPDAPNARKRPAKLTRGERA